MTETNGFTPNLIRRVNRGRTLRCILSRTETTRVDVASALHLTKTTMTNIVNDMISEGFLSESASHTNSHRLGRKSISLVLSDQSPLICGLLIMRHRICAVLGTMDGKIVDQIADASGEELTVARFRHVLSALFTQIIARAKRRVFAVSAVVIGPLDCEAGVMLKPTDFYAETEDFPLKDFLSTLTDLPIFISHDVAAAAMAEKLYGAAKNSQTFLFLSLDGGIGTGLYLDGRLYNGVSGQNGEIGHTSIRFDGEKCKCGNRGCLELYANAKALRRSAERYRAFLPKHRIFDESLNILEIIRLADGGDVLCTELLGEYCAYLSHALSNVITLMNIHEIYVGSPAEATCGAFERILSERLYKRLGGSVRELIQVKPSPLGVDAPLYGSIAVVMEQVFEGVFPLEALP